MKLKRLQPGYYYNRTPVVVQGVDTHVVIERSDGGSFWRLRLEDLPGWDLTYATKRGAKQALRDLVAGSLEPLLEAV